ELGGVELRGAHEERDLLLRVRDEVRELEERLHELVEALDALLLLGERAELRDLRLVSFGGGRRGGRRRRSRGGRRRYRGGHRRLRGRRGRRRERGASRGLFA